jgi:hypothetical protein
MKTYHITFYKALGDEYSTGVNIQAESMIEALATFNHDFGGIDPFLIVEKNIQQLLMTQK